MRVKERGEKCNEGKGVIAYPLQGGLFLFYTAPGASGKMWVGYIEVWINRVRWRGLEWCVICVVSFSLKYSDINNYNRGMRIYAYFAYILKFRVSRGTSC